MLEIEDLHVGYGKIVAVHGLTVSVRPGSIVAVLGPNGAGKTTSVRAIFGLLPVISGAIRFDGNRIDGLTPDRIIRKGMGLVPQGRELFAGLSVFDNLRLGAYTIKDETQIRQSMDQVYDYFPRLKERSRQAAGSLSGGEQQMLAIGRALMSNPRMLVLDEPSVGLGPMVIQAVFDIVARISRGRKVSVLVAEQNARQALRIADHAYLIEAGRLVTQGSPKTLMEDDAVRAAYLGTGATTA